MTPLKVVTYWVSPASETPLPDSSTLLEGLLAVFYEAFPEYAGMLLFSQSARPPRHVFVYVNHGCTGLLPPAGRFLQGLLHRAFPHGQVRAYGKVWQQ
jgi:hypothetical protein